MRHQKSGRKFGRNTSHRKAMFRNLAANLVLHERIETTDAKAKELRRIAERLITKALRLGDDLTADVAPPARAAAAVRVPAAQGHAHAQGRHDRRREPRPEAVRGDRAALSRARE